MTLREFITEASEEKAKAIPTGYFGVARIDIARELKNTMVSVSGDREYVNELFSKYIKVLGKEKYNSFASKKGIGSLSIFDASFDVESSISEVLGDWGNEKEVSFQ